MVEVKDLPYFYPLLSFLRIWAISCDVPFVFSMKETILSPLLWFLVFVLVLPLIVFLAFRTACAVVFFALPPAFASAAGSSLAVLC